MRNVATFAAAFLLAGATFAQPKDEPASAACYYSETITLPVGDDYLVAYVYRVCHELMVFEKNGDGFEATSELVVEFADGESGDVVFRDAYRDTAFVSDFRAASARDRYARGFIIAELESDSYALAAKFTDVNSDRTKDLKPKVLDVEATYRNEIGAPIVVRASENEGWTLANFGGAIPFGPREHWLIVPTCDLETRRVVVSFLSDSDTLEVSSEEFLDADAAIEKRRGDIRLSPRAGASARYFVVKGFSNSLREGAYRTRIVEEGGTPDTSETELFVRWIDKPIALQSTYYAVTMLRYVEDEEVVDDLLDADDQARALFEYWARRDPTPETEFNELMAEYYRRVDHARVEFRTFEGKDGASTDRGRVYIKYGPPSTVKREMNEYGAAIEIWRYEKNGKAFRFVDKSGLGNYKLE